MSKPVPPSRLNISYRTKIDGKLKKAKLPMRFLVLGDFTGKAPGLLGDRKIHSIMPGMKLDSFMQKLQLTAPIVEELKALLPGILDGEVTGKLEKSTGTDPSKGMVKFTGTGTVTGDESTNGLGSFIGKVLISGKAEVSLINGTPDFDNKEVTLKVVGKVEPPENRSTKVGAPAEDRSTKLGAPPEAGITGNIDGTFKVKLTKNAREDDDPGIDLRRKVESNDVKVQLTIPIRSLNDFKPLHLAASVPEIRRLVLLHRLVLEARNYISSHPELRDLVKVELEATQEQFKYAAVASKDTRLGLLQSMLRIDYPQLVLETKATANSAKTVAETSEAAIPTEKTKEAAEAEKAAAAAKAVTEAATKEVTRTDEAAAAAKDAAAAAPMDTEKKQAAEATAQAATDAKQVETAAKQVEAANKVKAEADQVKEAADKVKAAADALAEVDKATGPTKSAAKAAKETADKTKETADSDADAAKKTAEVAKRAAEAAEEAVRKATEALTRAKDAASDPADVAKKNAAGTAKTKAVEALRLAKEASKAIAEKAEADAVKAEADAVKAEAVAVKEAADAVNTEADAAQKAAETAARTAQETADRAVRKASEAVKATLAEVDKATGPTKSAAKEVKETADKAKANADKAKATATTADSDAKAAKKAAEDAEDAVKKAIVAMEKAAEAALAPTDEAKKTAAGTAKTKAVEALRLAKEASNLISEKTAAAAAKAPLLTWATSVGLKPELGMRALVQRPGTNLMFKDREQDFPRAERFANSVAALLANIDIFPVAKTEEKNQNLLPVDSIQKLMIAVDELAVKINKKVQENLQKIVHSKPLRQLESTWRSLDELCREVTSDEVIIDFLDADIEMLRTDFEDHSSYILNSALFRKVYIDEYDRYGGRPIGAMIGLYEFDNTDTDIDWLQTMSQICSAAHCPFISTVRPEFFDVNNWEELERKTDLEELLALPQFGKWHGFRESHGAAYIGLTLPRYLLRKPYEQKADRNQIISYEEEIKVPEDYLWGNAAVLLARNMVRSFERSGWCQHLTGPVGGGLVKGLPVHMKELHGQAELQPPVEIAIPDYRELQFANAGFIPLIHCKGTADATFFSVRSVKKAVEFEDDRDTKNADLVCNLSYTLSTTRIAHYVKRMVRDYIGSTANAPYIQATLEAWLVDYVTTAVNPDDLTLWYYPFKAMSVTVVPKQGPFGWYNCIINVLPHAQFQGMDVELRLEAALGGK